MKSSVSQFISGEEIIQSDATKKTSTNQIHADCVGEKLTLYVNDKLVATASDIGPIAGTFDAIGVDIHFDNFVVRKP